MIKPVPRAKHANGPGVQNVVDWLNETVKEESVRQICVVMVNRDGSVSWHRSREIGSQLIGMLEIIKAEIIQDYIDST